MEHLPHLTSPAPGPARAAPRAAAWDPIDRLRTAAARRLEAIAAEHGAGSPFHLSCLERWGRAEGEAALSLLHADFGNAARQLERALHVLDTAPAVARRGELAVAELAALMRAV